MLGRNLEVNIVVGILYSFNFPAGISSSYLVIRVAALEGHEFLPRVLSGSGKEETLFSVVRLSRCDLELGTMELMLTESKCGDVSKFTLFPSLHCLYDLI